VLTITWEPRDKALIQDQPVDASMQGVGDPSVVYKLRLVRVDTGAQLAEAEVTDDTQATLFSGFSGTVRLEVRAWSNEFDPDTASLASYDVSFVYVSTGYGRAYGFAYGGTLRSGAIAPRGGIAASPENITPIAEIDGQLFGLWRVSEDLQFRGLVSSFDGLNWASIAEVPGSSPMQKVNGTWYLGGGKFFADDVAGPYASTPNDVLGNSSVRFIGGAQFLGGRWVLRLGSFGVPGPGLYATDGAVLDQFEQMPAPEPITNNVVIPEGSIAHGDNGFVQIWNDTDNPFAPLVSSQSQARLYHSIDLENWTLVTPQLLDEGDFGSAGLIGKWAGSVAFVGGRYLLMATLGQSEGGERVIFTSTNGQTWTQATEVGELGIGLTLPVVFHDGNYIYTGGSRNVRNLGPPQRLISTDSLSWQVDTQDPLATPQTIFRAMSSPAGLIALAGGPASGPEQFVERFALHLSTDNGLTWQPINMQRPDSV